MKQNTHRMNVWIAVGAITGTIAVDGCEKANDKSGGEPAAGVATAYCSVDEVFARTVFDAYRTRTGREVRVVFDSEAGKTTGLVNRIIEEARAGRTRADVFWSSELFGTILLARRGLLQPYEPPKAGDIPPRFRDKGHRWTALGVRARVLAFDPTRTNASEAPSDWESLSEPRFARSLALANPLFGTTRGHVAAMFATWGEERGRTFLTKLREGGALVVDGNSAAVRAVMSGRAKFAMTDTDDVFLARKSGASLELAYLDMGGGGTLLIPCSVAIVNNAPRPTAARDLVDFLLSADAERLLAGSDSRNVPVRAPLRTELGMNWPPESAVDYDAVADAVDMAVSAVREILIR